MKALKTLVAIALSTVTLGSAVAIGVGAGSKISEPEAAYAEGSHTIYFATETSRSNYYARCQYGNNDYGSHTFSNVGRSGNLYIYSASVYEKYGGLDNLWIKYGNDPSGDTGGTLVVQAISGWKTVSVYENKVYYSGWKNIYTVTYNANGGKGNSKTDYKIEGVSYSVLSYANAGISAAGGRYALKWNANASGSSTNYQPGASYTTNANLSLYLIQDWYTYQYRINSGSWNTLTKKSSVPSGYVAEFESTTASFTTGDTITFQRYYGSATPTSVSPSAWENNISSSGVIYYSYDGKIYVKVTNDDGHTVYAEGFSERGVSIVRGGQEYKCACSKDSDTQWHVNNITLLPSDTLKATYNGGTSYAIYVENTDVYGISSSGVVSTPGVYTIYLKSTDGGYNFPNVYLSMEDDASAKLIAQTFNTALTSVCESTVSGGSTSQITSAFSTQKNYYDHLTQTCQTKVKSSSSDADVVNMRAKYDYIVGKYGTTIAPDYMGRNPAPIGSASILGSVINKSADTGAIIAIASAMVITATGAYFFLRKKRKEQ